jgi:hypothetical protein
MSLVFHPLEEESSSDSMRLKWDARPCPIAKHTKGSDPYVTQNQWLRRVHHLFQIDDGPHLPFVGKCGAPAGSRSTQSDVEPSTGTFTRCDSEESVTASAAEPHELADNSTEFGRFGA